MPVFAALLRAVNVGGTGKLPMADLVALCEAAGFTGVRTSLASGNVVFRTWLSDARAKAALEARLKAYAGRPVGVVLRTQAELAAVLANNPFPDAPPDEVIVVFFDAPPDPECVAKARQQRDERLHLAGRELYIHYPGGLGKSKLVLPAARTGTGRNLNTVARLLKLLAKAEPT